MEKVEIVAGLRSALARGYSLEFAKKSFVNAGYNFQDVEDSASLLATGKSSNPAPPSSAPVTTSTVQSSPIQAQAVQSAAQPIQPVQIPAQPAYKPLPRVPSQVQDYQRTTDLSGRPRKKGVLLVIILIIIFLIVLGVLGLLLFKRELVESLLRSWGLI